MNTNAKIDHDSPIDRAYNRDKIVEALLRRSRYAQKVLPQSRLYSIVVGSLQAKIDHVMSSGDRIQLVIPSFPYKSPNRNRVNSEFADMAEYLSILSLAGLVKEIEELWPHGCQLILASDGRVYRPLQTPWWPGFTDQTILNYQASLARIIQMANAERQIRQVSLDDFEKFHGAAGYDRFAREAPSCASIEAEIKSDESALRVYLGMKYFREQELAQSPMARALSGKSIKKHARAFTIDQLRFGRAWSNVLRDHFPNAIRLSVHAHFTEAKLGIFLYGQEEKTPWHSTVVWNCRTNSWNFMKRIDAIRIGAMPSTWSNLAFFVDSRPALRSV